MKAAARVALFSPMSICVPVRIFLSVCQRSVTPEPLRDIITRFSEPHPIWAKGRPCSKMTTASGLTSLASIVSNIIRLFSSGVNPNLF